MKFAPKNPALRPVPAELVLPDEIGEFRKPVTRSRVVRVGFGELASEGLMDKFVIRGGNRLVGSIRISGAKNAALPAMAAALLTDEPVILENIPDVRDIQTERNLLVSMGAEV